MRLFQEADETERYLSQKISEEMGEEIGNGVNKEISDILKHYRTLAEKMATYEKRNFWKDLNDVIAKNDAYNLLHFHNEFKKFENTLLYASRYLQEIGGGNEGLVGIMLSGRTGEIIYLKMPVSSKEINSFLENNNILERNDYEIEYVQCRENELNVEFYHLAANTDLLELNYFFKCLSDMNELQKHQFTNAVKMYSPENMKDFINLTANAKGIYALTTSNPNVIDKNELGKLLVENNFCDKDIIHDGKQIDYAMTAEYHMLISKWAFKGCAFREGIYIEDRLPPEQRTEIYDGRNIPEIEPMELDQQPPEQSM